MVRIQRQFTRSTTVPGRHIISLWASKLFEKSGIRNLFGLNLVAAIFVAGIVTPEASNILSQRFVADNAPTTLISANISTETTIESPLATYAVSQVYTFWHQGIDMTASEGTPIYAIEDGVVEFADNTFFGYGKHVIIAHDRDMKSLYGHMSEILTEAGRKVARGDIIGKVGSTGWSTGNHLHLEIYQNGKSINPLEVLPIKIKDIQWDGGIAQKVSEPQRTSDVETVENGSVLLPSPTPAMALIPAKPASTAALLALPQ